MLKIDLLLSDLSCDHLNLVHKYIIIIMYDELYNTLGSVIATTAIKKKILILRFGYYQGGKGKISH